MSVVLRDRPRGTREGLQAVHGGHLLVAAGRQRSGDPEGAADVGGAAAEGPGRAGPPALRLHGPTSQWSPAEVPPPHKQMPLNI